MPDLAYVNGCSSSFRLQCRELNANWITAGDVVESESSPFITDLYIFAARMVNSGLWRRPRWQTLMTTLSINHRTTYRYRVPLKFGAHRLMLRPRESHNLRLLAYDLACTPVAKVTWAHDVMGNTVANAVFSDESDTLVVESTAKLSLDVDRWPVFNIAASASSYPFLLSEDDMTDLGALRLQSYLDSTGRLADWAQSFVAGNPTDTLTLLKDISAGAAATIAYEIREEEHTQSPVETLVRGRGSCRDFAALFVDAVRSLGFGARIVSGYLYDPEQELQGSAGLGTTHAWAEVYVPGAGWITFDPTNRSIGGHNLIPVAVARHIRQTIPVAGSFVGSRDSFECMEVSVSVTADIQQSTAVPLQGE